MPKLAHFLFDCAARAGQRQRGNGGEVVGAAVRKRAHKRSVGGHIVGVQRGGDALYKPGRFPARARSFAHLQRHIGGVKADPAPEITLLRIVGIVIVGAFGRIAVRRIAPGAVAQRHALQQSIGIAAGYSAQRYIALQRFAEFDVRRKRLKRALYVVRAAVQSAQQQHARARRIDDICVRMQQRRYPPLGARNAACVQRPQAGVLLHKGFASFVYVH